MYIELTNLHTTFFCDYIFLAVIIEINVNGIIENVRQGFRVDFYIDDDITETGRCKMA